MEMHSRQSLYAVHGFEVRTSEQLLHRWTARIAAGLTKMRLALRREMRARRAAAELASMNDRMLRDIGISRDEIEGVVRHSGRLQDGCYAARPATHR